jgi:hypothetical protein
MIIAYRVHNPAVGLACGTAIGGVLYLAARWRHWVLPSAARLRAGIPSEAPAASTEPVPPIRAASAEPEHSDAVARGLIA